MENVEFLGLVAACCTTAAFMPQVYRAWKSKSVRDISLFMYLVFLTGTILWFIYGILIYSISIILANGITSILALIIIYLKLKYR
ncbi:SemiSWEET family sugar transporter [Robiginitalea sp. IMCC43444]|uniref:SemiSWEET family sugar transporter n=1 Tax=Robiginitalea sp. IMCC43444 TaxID=3459121 RepID=UPI0040423B69